MKEEEIMRTANDAERKQTIKSNGLVCLGRLHGDQTWEDWMGVGAALEVITEEALAAVGAKVWDKDNKQAVKEFNHRWEDYESGNGKNVKPLSKQERWALREAMTNPEVAAYRATLTGPEKRKLNHPNAVVNRLRARAKAMAIPSDDKPLSPFEKLKQANVKLQEENHRLSKKSDDDGNQINKDSSAKDVAVVIIGAFEALPSRVSRIKEVIKNLNAWVKAQEAAKKTAKTTPQELST